MQHRIQDRLYPISVAYTRLIYQGSSLASRYLSWTCSHDTLPEVSGTTDPWACRAHVINLNLFHNKYRSIWTYLGFVKNWNGKEQRRCKSVGAWPHCMVSWFRLQLCTYWPTSTISDCSRSALSTALGLAAWPASLLDTTDVSSSAVQ